MSTLSNGSHKQTNNFEFQFFVKYFLSQWNELDQLQYKKYLGKQQWKTAQKTAVFAVAVNSNQKPQ